MNCCQEYDKIGEKKYKKREEEEEEKMRYIWDMVQDESSHMKCN